MGVGEQKSNVDRGFPEVQTKRKEGTSASTLISDIWIMMSGTQDFQYLSVHLVFSQESTDFRISHMVLFFLSKYFVLNMRFVIA